MTDSIKKDLEQIQRKIATNKVHEVVSNNTDTGTQKAITSIEQLRRVYERNGDNRSITAIDDQLKELNKENFSLENKYVIQLVSFNSNVSTETVASADRCTGSIH